MTVLLVLGLLLLGDRRRAPVAGDDRVAAPRDGHARADRPATASRAPADQEREPGFRGLLECGRRVARPFFTDGLHVVNAERSQKTLIAAGIRQTTPDMLVGYSAFCAIALPLIWIVIAVAIGASTAVTILLTIFFAAVGWVAPGFVAPAARRRTASTGSTTPCPS